MARRSIPVASALSCRSRRWSLLIALVLTATPALACSDGTDGAAPPAAAPAPSADAAGDARETGSDASLVWELPEGWTEVPPSNRMRMAEATIPGAAGEGTLVLFFFGPGQGGEAEANIERWLGQMEVEGEPERESFESEGLTVTWVDVAGTLKPSRMGVGPTEPVPGSRLLGAVVEGPGGPWFFKATGPAETLADAREDFLAMLRAARVE